MANINVSITNKYNGVQRMVLFKDLDRAVDFIKSESELIKKEYNWMGIKYHESYHQGGNTYVISSQREDGVEVVTFKVESQERELAKEVFNRVIGDIEKPFSHVIEDLPLKQPDFVEKSFDQVLKDLDS